LRPSVAPKPTPTRKYALRGVKPEPTDYFSATNRFKFNDDLLRKKKKPRIGGLNNDVDSTENTKEGIASPTPSQSTTSNGPKRYQLMARAIMLKCKDKMPPNNINNINTNNNSKNISNGTVIGTPTKIIGTPTKIIGTPTKSISSRLVRQRV